MPTLWEMLKRKVSGEEEEQVVPVEFQFYNPLQLRIDDVMKIDIIDGGEDLSPLNFPLRQIRAVNRQIGEREFPFVDYDVVSQSLETDQEIRMRVRLLPMEDPDTVMTHNVILFKKLAEFGYDKGFHENLNTLDQIDEHEAFEASYWRPEGIRDPYVGETAYLRDEDSDGTVEEHEVRRGELTYWDFHRETEDASGKFIEWYMVEMDENGFFEIWVGREVRPERITV